MEVVGVSLKIGRSQAREYNVLAIAGREHRSISSVGEMVRQTEVRADPGDADNILARVEIGDHVALITFRRREIKGVSPTSAAQRVVARAACEIIIAVAAEQMIVASIAEEIIIAADVAG